jgi:hypothetical protein
VALTSDALTLVPSASVPPPPHNLQPIRSAYFYGFNAAQHRLNAWNSARSPDAQIPRFAVDAAAGLVADIVATPLWTPIEVVTTRLQIQGPGVVQ